MALLPTVLVAICAPKGLAAAHFRWPEQNLALMKAESRRLLWIAVPAVLVVHLAVDLYPAQSGVMAMLAKPQAAVGLSRADGCTSSGLAAVAPRC